jgi:hypothetical protein
VNDELKQKVGKYVNNAFTAAQLKANEVAQVEVANVRAKLSTTGNLFSSSMDYEMIRIESEKINNLLKVRGDALLDAYEIYNSAFDEAAILQDVAEMRNTLIAAISNSAQAQDSLLALRTGHNDPGGAMRYENFKRQLTIRSQTIGYELTCQIEQRKVTPKMKRPEGVNITYHLRENARVNINSTDQSVNSVIVSQEQLFTAIRDVVTQQISGADQQTVLAKLDDLQHAQGTKGFSDKFTAFMGVSADFITILGPFLPALTELAKNALGN